ncbi:hypothetical protein [Flavobacterium hiemivividum]|uniref:Ig-like domain-containing protein n=1 Tax=Flavobacterium hiemivividum TaxID=2541734 RepID=A0A4R5CQA2_9FLAO|nr:hypothetical protein [Flavobacterium hiemivividum]TDE02326.1 hypothetical protein E0F98_12920 [Flavobacterium hiemivividum]
MKKNKISKNFDGFSGKIISYLLMKNTISKLDNLKSNERNVIEFLASMWASFWRRSLAITFIMALILLAGYTVEAQNIKGVVPVQFPIAGSGVDGDAWAHEPSNPSPSLYLNVGDLFDRQFGNPAYPLDVTNNGVLDFTTGNLLYPGFTFFLQDRYTDDLTIFTSSNKINDDPNTYTWGPGSSPNKNEIQNAGAHFSYGSAGVTGGESVDGITFVSGTSRPGNPNDLWCLFAGDRQVTNGSSYIDFEFLQKPLTINGASFSPFDPTTGTSQVSGGSGGFTSLGTQGGRTVGDILITIEFTQGGGEATVVIRTWKAKAGGGYEYVVISNSSFPGNIFCTNNNVTTTVPFDAYGTIPGTYAPNQWAEGAINLSEVFRQTSPNDPCFNVSTLFIRTRSSGSSSQSELKDFPGAPIQLSLNLIPVANAGADFTKTCTTNPNGKQIGETPEAGFTYSWSPATGLSNASISNPMANPLVNTTYTVTKTKTGTVCSNTDEVMVTVNVTPPNANAGDDKVLTCAITSIALSGSSTTADATFSWVASNGGNIVSGANSATPTVNAAGTYTLTVTDPVNGCTATDVALVTLNNTLPNANAGVDKVLTCTVTSIALSGSSTTAGATFSWAASNGGNIVSGATTATPTVNAAGTYTLTVTNPANGCTATDVAVVTLDANTPNANAGADKVLTCTVTSIVLSGSSTTAGATFSWIASNGGFIVSGANSATPTVNAAGTYTLTVTNPANGCTATDVALVTLNNTAPNANAGADKVLTCSITSIALSGSSSTADATFSWIASNGGFIVSGANSATPTVNAAGTYTLTVTNPANGCTATDVALVTLNNTAPNANAGADKVLTCSISSIALSGSSTTAGATFSWAASNGGNIVSGANSATPTVNSAGTYTLTVTNPANGCTATDVAVVTLDANTPNANAGADKVLTCTVTSIVLSGSSTTAGATFSWIASNGGFIVSGANSATPTVNAAGTYTLTVTNPANGCTATDVALVTLNNTAPNANAGADKVLTCTITSIALSGSSSTADATFSWIASNGGFIVSGANSATPTVNSAGTYTLTVTNPANGCTATDVALVTLNNTAPNANAGADKVLTCTITSIALSGSSSTADATFSWIASNGGFIVSGANSATPTVNAAGTYTLTVTNPANGCTATDVALVTLNNTAPNANAGVDTQILCSSTTAILSGSSTTAGATFAWVASNGGNIVSGANTATPTVNAAGTYTLTVTNPANGCTATDIALVTVQICAKALCTYTQGYYGNLGGMSCAPDGGIFSKYTTKELIAKALASYGGTMTIGSVTNNLKFPNTVAGVQAIIDLLPGGGGGSYALTGSYIVSVDVLPGSYLTKKGTLNNTLLAQTTTLGLNIGINGALGGFVLQGGMLVTADSEGGCGSDIPKTRICNYDALGNFIGVTNDYHYTSIDGAVVTALGPNPTIQKLFILANQSLGGAELPAGVSLSQIASVVDAINNAFDGCKIFMGYNVERCTGDLSGISAKITADKTTELAGFTANPVPFEDKLTITYGFDYVSKVKIEVFDARGGKVHSQLDNNSYLGKEVVLNLNVKRGQEQVYIVKLATDRGSSTKKVMSSK